MVTTAIKKGYKKTELGVIPEDWSVNKLDDLTIKIGSGITPTGGETVYKEYGRPLVRSQNIGWGKLLLDDIAFIDDETHQTFPNTEIKLHDVFLNISGASIGRSSYANEKLVGGNVNQHVCIIRTVDRLLDPVFLNIFLLSKNGQRQIDSFQSGGNRQGLNIGQIKTFQISLPPTKPEQSAIATVLSDTDKLIDHLDKLITKKKDVKQGTMQQLLTGKTRLPGFSGKWKENTIQALEKVGMITLSRGRVISKIDIAQNPGDYPIYSSSVHNNGKFGQYGEFMFDEELITWSVDGGGHFFYRPKHKFSVTNVCGFMRVDTKKIDYKFISLQLQLLHSRLFFDYTMKAHPSIIRKAYNLMLPTLGEQTAIATILSDMDAEIEKLEQKRDKYAMLKNGMMQQLLTGNIRIYANK